ncbi:MAG: hypothetical protein J6R47_05460 [Acholeplasmatales bacterium]|nr:hypothetical protein [Acholeplasmatales bacterium]
MIKGQERICSFIDNCSLDDFPRSLMLIGERGSGKHLLCNYICQRFNLESLDITEDISLDLIDKINERVTPYLYIIKINSLNIKDENTILKLLEEPLKNAYLVLLTETTNGILPTILNRCQPWRLQNYSKEFLKSFLKEDNPDLLNIATTPGQILQMQGNNFKDMYILCDKIINKIAEASIPNILTISNKIGFKDEKDKLNYQLTLLLIKELLCKYYRDYSDIRYLKGYSILNQLLKDLKNATIDPKPLFDKWLLDFRSIMKG